MRGPGCRAWPAPWSIGFTGTEPPERGDKRIRSSSLVRFDVTKIVMGWDSGTLDNNGFVIDVVPADLAPANAVAFIEPKDIQLVYHTVPNGAKDAQLIKKDHSKRHLPQAEGQGGQPH